MSDTTFRTVQQEAKVEEPMKGSTSHSVASSNVEVPYLDYEREHGKPYIVDHFALGENWVDRDGGYIEEVRAIENYLQNQVEDREVDNSLKGIKNRLKEIEKVTNMDKEDRMVVKLEVLAEYVKFLSKTRDIKKNITRYGSN